jgi:hypothetical protein
MAIAAACPDLGFELSGSQFRSRAGNTLAQLDQD